MSAAASVLSGEPSKTHQQAELSLLQHLLPGAFTCFCSLSSWAVLATQAEARLQHGPVRGAPA